MFPQRLSLQCNSECETNIDVVKKLRDKGSTPDFLDVFCAVTRSGVVCKKSAFYNKLSYSMLV
jgi:hypothetical protein